MTNILKAIGKLTNFRMSHEYQDKDGKTVQYFKSELAVQRLSDVNDYIPLVISSNVLGDLEVSDDAYVAVEGELRTRNYTGNDGRNHLAVYVKATNIKAVEGTPENEINEVEFEGIICKAPTLRETTSGRVISDLLLAHNSRSKKGYRTKSYYVPALTWGSAAKAVHKHLHVGDDVVVKGRLQSRKYHCKNDPADVFHWAYEISVNDFQTVNTEDESDNNVA